MVFGRLAWSDGIDPIAKHVATAGLIWRPGFYDDLFGVAATWAEPVTPGLGNQKTIEDFYRLELSDNLALMPDIPYPKNPGFNREEPLEYGPRARFSL